MRDINLCYENTLDQQHYASVKQQAKWILPELLSMDSASLA
jgi:hypothetical protein